MGDYEVGLGFLVPFLWVIGLTLFRGCPGESPTGVNLVVEISLKAALSGWRV